jgi:hypothetical protein
MFYSLKEQAIRDYIAKINFKQDWNYKVIEENMRKFLGERPFLDATYKKDVMLNEVSGEAKEIKTLEKISIIFTDTDDKPKKIDIIIN